MTHGADSVQEPIPISLIAGRYLLFDVDVATYLRRTYHILGVLIGGIPQVPQQNVFMGLPVELLPEEARLLVEKNVAYIIDDASWHKDNFSLQGEDRKRYIESLQSQGRAARRLAEEISRKKTEHALGRQAAARARKQAEPANDLESSLNTSLSLDSPSQEQSLFSEDRPSSRASSIESSIPKSTDSYPVTPSVTYTSTSPPKDTPSQQLPVVPSSYPLFAHLHSRKYFMMPGLRFGCDYNVYPGDPLRFHSHFLAVGYEWDQEIPLLDLIGGGRLGTGVKKGFLIGGKDVTHTKEEDGDGVRTFCIEWGGM